MILYTLACGAGHRFESWFRDSAAYDDQVAAALVTCPICRSTEIAKTIMAPAVARRASTTDTGPGLAVPGSAAPGSAALGLVGPGLTGPASEEPAMEVALIDDKSRELRALLRAVRDKVVAEGHDVGADFATEARRMHDGATPVRQIYGQASPSEARDLIEDGILILPMPIVPDELN